MTIAYLLAYSKPVEGREGDYHQWYDEVHLPEVLALEGVLSGRRFDYAALGVSEGDSPSYLAIYELDRDPAEVLQALNAGIASGEIHLSDAIDPTSLTMCVAHPRADTARSTIV